MKKGLSLALSLLLVLSTLFALPFNAMAEPKSIKDESITINVKKAVFDENTGIINDLEIEVKDGETVLVENTDYTYELENDYEYIKLDGTTSTSFQVEGIGNYTDCREEVYRTTAPTKGKIGNNAYWIYDIKNKFLRIGGKGKLTTARTGDAKYVYIDGVSSTQSHWAYVYGDTVERVAFNNITITGNVKTIGENTFYTVTGVKNMNIMSGVKTLKKGALATSYNTFKSVYIPKSVTKMGKGSVGYVALRRYSEEKGVIYYKYEKTKGFVIVGEKGSTAQKYAKKNKIKFVALKPSAISKVKAGKGAFTATWKKAKDASGYQIQYSPNKYFEGGNKAVKVKKAKNVKKTVKKLKAGKYYVRVRTYKTVKKKTYYSNWSKAKVVTVK